MTSLAFIPSPSTNGFYIGPLFFHAYGIAYVFGVMAAILISRWGWRRQGGDPDLVYDVAMWAVTAGIVGGDVITSVNGQAVSSPASLTKLMVQYGVGQQVTVVWVDPSGHSHTSGLTLTAHPPA